MFRATRHQWCVRGGAALAGAAALVLYGVALWFGNLNQDEGWYLYAARLVAGGRLPYRDFFFTQGPVMPHVYGVLAPLWSPHGVLGGRVATACLGLLGCLLAAALARRAVPLARAPEAGVMAFALTAGNLYHAYFTTIPKTYALASCLLLGGYLLLSLCVSRRKRTRSTMSNMWALTAGALIACAAGTRLSLGLLLPVTALGLLISWRRTGAAFFWFTLGGALGLALVFGPIIGTAWDPFVFGHTFHAGRGGHDPFLIAGSLARLTRAYLPLALLGVAVVVFRLYRGFWGGASSARGNSAANAYQGYLWPWHWLAAFVAVFALHLAAPFPYDDYQVPLMGLLAAALSAMAVNGTSSGTLRGCICLFWVVASLANSFGSPMAQEWMVARQDRFWVARKSMSDLALLRCTARDVKALAAGDDLLLTQDLYLAVECGMRVPEGFEMGPFGYFPELDDAAAERYHVLNSDRLEALLTESEATVAAYSGYGFAIRAPVMDEVPARERQRLLHLLGCGYDGVQSVAGFGQSGTTLQIMRRRQAASPVEKE